MTLEETVLAIRLHKLAVALGVFMVSAPAFSHGHHSHGKPLTEVEQKAANGVFDDANVQNRKLSDWDGGFAPIFPDTCYHLTHYWPAAADIPVASDNPVHYADAIRYNARTPLQGSLLPLTRLV